MIIPAAHRQSGRVRGDRKTRQLILYVTGVWLLILALGCASGAQAGQAAAAGLRTAGAALQGCPGGVTTRGYCCQQGCACGGSCIHCGYRCYQGPDGRFYYQ